MADGAKIFHLLPGALFAHSKIFTCCPICFLSLKLLCQCFCKIIDFEFALGHESPKFCSGTKCSGRMSVSEGWNARPERLLSLPKQSEGNARKISLYA